MTVNEIDTELAQIAAQMKPLASRAAELERSKRTLLSQQFIAQHSITRDNIELSSGDGIPYHGTVWQFADWLRTKPNRLRFAEWNKGIHFTAELLDGMFNQSPASIDDLPV